MKNVQKNENIRNIAIIAHVDHGKTTLVDQMFKQSGLFRENQAVDERIMDRMDLEKERGITISAKNCAVQWNGVKINILDTPGHADFGGEVERALAMVDGAILLVDSSEGPLPQTRFVLKKALESQLSIIVVINKIDRQDARSQEVLNQVYDLFIDLHATEEQIEFPVLYAIGRDGIAKRDLEEESENLVPLFETIIAQIDAPTYDPSEPFQMLVADLDYSEYVGKLAIGRIAHGTLTKNEPLICVNEHEEHLSMRATKLQVYEGLGMQEVDDVQAGDILILAGTENIHIGDTVCTKDQPRTMKRIAIDEPTIAMYFYPNTSPLAGQEGKIIQANKIRERIIKETLRNVSLEFEDADETEKFLVKGRGELQMAILIETMRREGYELAVGRPEVIYKHENGHKLEPIEQVYIDCEESCLGVVSEKLSKRKGKMISLTNNGSGRIRAQFDIPSRGLIGYRNEFLTDTRGTGMMNAYLSGYEPYRGDFPTRFTGSLVADRSGKAVTYAIFNLEPRGTLFVTRGEKVYEGMIVGEHNREADLQVNICKEKKLSNVRASGKDDTVVLTPVLPMSLERAIEFIRDGEIVEVTPENIRLRKFILNPSARAFAAKKK